MTVYIGNFSTNIAPMMDIRKKKHEYRLPAQNDRRGLYGKGDQITDYGCPNRKTTEEYNSFAFNPLK